MSRMAVTILDERQLLSEIHHAKRREVFCSCFRIVTSMGRWLEASQAWSVLRAHGFDLRIHAALHVLLREGSENLRSTQPLPADSNMGLRTCELEYLFCSRVLPRSLCEF